MWCVGAHLNRRRNLALARIPVSQRQQARGHVRSGSRAPDRPELHFGRDGESDVEPLRPGGGAYPQSCCRQSDLLTCCRLLQAPWTPKLAQPVEQLQSPREDAGPDHDGVSDAHFDGIPEMMLEIQAAGTGRRKLNRGESERRVHRVTRLVVEGQVPAHPGPDVPGAGR